MTGTNATARKLDELREAAADAAFKRSRARSARIDAESELAKAQAVEDHFSAKVSALESEFEQVAKQHTEAARRVAVEALQKQAPPQEPTERGVLWPNGHAGMSGPVREEELPPASQEAKGVAINDGSEPAAGA